MSRTRHIGMAAAMVLGLTLTPLMVDAATITIVNIDGANEGFNDPTGAAPVGGNPGVTVGQQRLNVFTQAAAIWGGILPSAVTIVVSSRFDTLSCNATSAVLGSAGPITAHANFPGAEVIDHWYHQALANKLRGADNAPANNDIQAAFNSKLGLNGCLTGSGWYYGFDHNQGTGIDLLAVVLHELGHGLGFSTTTSPSTGNYFSGPPALPAIWDKYLQDRVSGLHWDQMTAGQRQASAISTGNLVWDGPATTFMAPFLLQQPRLLVNSPPVIAGTYSAGTAEFGSDLTSTGVTGDLVLATDGAGPATNDGCEAFTNAGAVAGNVALVDRGNCPFTQKATNAFSAGATALVIANNMPGLFDMTGSAPGVTIPVIMIQQADGNAIKAQLGGGVNVTVGLDPTVHPGTSPEDKVLMYAPNPVAPGSSVSHFDISLQPNALMEPAINGDLTDDVDLTRYLFEDIGWLPRTTDTSQPPRAAAGVALRGVPNPFRATTQMRVNLASAGMVELTVLDIGGRSVRHLIRSWMPAGQHLVTWDGTDGEGHSLPSGVYLTRLKAGGASVTQRIVRME